MQQHICRACYMLSPICLSVCLTSGSVKNGWSCDLWSCNFHHRVVLAIGVSNKGGVGENRLFSSFVHWYLENSTRYDQSYYQWPVRSCICTFY